MTAIWGTLNYHFSLQIFFSFLNCEILVTLLSFSVLTNGILSRILCKILLFSLFYRQGNGRHNLPSFSQVAKLQRQILNPSLQPPEPVLLATEQLCLRRSTSIFDLIITSKIFCVHYRSSVSFIQRENFYSDLKSSSVETSYK